MTIRKSNNGVSPSLDIAIDRVEVDYRQLQHIEMRLDNCKHDMLKLSMSGIPARAITDYIGRPVYCSLSSGPGFTEEFYGYVIEVKPSSEARGGTVSGTSPFQDAELVCVGASYIMRNASNRSWNGYPIAEVVESIATSYGFTLDFPASNYGSLIPQLSEKDWPFIVKLCKYNGLRVTAHGTHVHVHDPYQAHARQISVHYIYAVRGTKVNPSPGQIISFDGRFTERRADSRFSKKVVTVSYESGDSFDVGSDELPINTYGSTASRYTEYVGDLVGSYEEALSVLNSHVKESYDFEADISVVGLLGIKPGGIIDVQRYRSDFDGLWYVDGVCHRLNSAGTFVTDIRAMKNVVSEFASPASAPVFRPPAPPTLDSSAWVSSKMRSANVY
jgi:hypothetical protein